MHPRDRRVGRRRAGGAGALVRLPVDRRRAAQRRPGACAGCRQRVHGSAGPQARRGTGSGGGGGRSRALPPSPMAGAGRPGRRGPGPWHHAADPARLEPGPRRRRPAGRGGDTARGQYRTRSGGPDRGGRGTRPARRATRPLPARAPGVRGRAARVAARRFRPQSRNRVLRALTGASGSPSHRAHWLPALVVGVLLAAATASRAEPVASGAAASRPIPTAEAHDWLARIHAAAHRSNYQGTLVSSADGALSSSRVAHFCDDRGCYERVEVLDGRMQQTYRHNDRVTTLWPQIRVAVIEEREPKQASLRQVVEPRVQDHYELRDQGEDHVAGREARVLLLSPRDAHRFAQRLWIDSKTGLVLRADVLGLRQQVLESSAFSQVEIGVKPRPQTVLQPIRNLDGWRLVRPTHAPTRLDREGWTLEPPIPGFRLIGATMRTLDPAESGTAKPPVLQAVYSDGLTHVSLFIEPIDRQRPKRPIRGQVGATFSLMQPFGEDWWVTVIGDVPESTLTAFSQALQRKP